MRPRVGRLRELRRRSPEPDGPRVAVDAAVGLLTTLVFVLILGGVGGWLEAISQPWRFSATLALALAVFLPVGFAADRLHGRRHGG